jgi:pimeloyl-ACP methyl ester carboxylesterase
MLTTTIFKAARPRFDPVILLHAFPLSSEMWSPTLNILKSSFPDRDYITIEFPGFGENTSVQNWTMGHVAEEIKVMMDDLEIEHAVLAGISMGGYAAFAFYRAFPNRVAALVLSNTKPAEDTAEGKLGREEFAKEVERRGSIVAVERMLPKFIVEDVVLEQPKIESHLRSCIETARPGAIAAALRAMAQRSDSTDLLSKITAPTMVIAGEKDAFFSPSDTEAWARQIPHSEYLLIDGAGHLTPLDKPLEWAGAVQGFLKNRVDHE